ncbi:Nicotinamide N-methyltransferase-like protein [Cynara cardunculus var. scolymus]|uniref:Nicotinamide N-methyltransferase-like protein n=1 Tax=Cynara cardunculus var. scolymus TaxID=59895 RepID=A0A118JRU8_CYNCS|nr:Nicotinamide N-methyltransferase-like protein [Cynara cardunculus var. scolymus]
MSENGQREDPLIKPNGVDSDDDDTVCLGESFFINDNYELTTFTFGSHVLQLLCLQSASTDFDLTGQLVWPGARLLNEYLSNNAEILQGCSAIELGSGVGITGILCSKFCRAVMLTDHNDEVLKAWLQYVIFLHKHLNSVPLLFNTVQQLLCLRGKKQCRFILAYVSRSKMMDVMVTNEAIQHGLKIHEVDGTRCVIANLEGVIYEIIL